MKLSLPFMLASSVMLIAAGPHSAYVDTVLSADRTGRLYPAVTTASPGTTLGEAYRIQRELVAAKIAVGDRIVGFKAGLMTPAGQKARGAREPVFGVLLASGRHASEATLSNASFRTMLLELEIGYVFGRTVRHRIPDEATLKTYIRSIQPVIEVPDLAFDASNYDVRDMVAANVSSHAFVTGRAQAVALADVNMITPTLTRDGERIVAGRARDALGDQWKALLDIANRAIAAGYVIRPGQVIITGQLGEKGNGIPGNYHADYGPLGVVDFRIVNATRSR